MENYEEYSNENENNDPFRYEASTSGKMIEEENEPTERIQMNENHATQNKGQHDGRLEGSMHYTMEKQTMSQKFESSQRGHNFREEILRQYFQNINEIALCIVRLSYTLNF